MPSWLKRMLLMVVVVLLATPVYSEYYQYTDSNGVLRFTDNIANVPQEQRPDVKTHQSVKSSPAQPKTRVKAAEEGSRLSTPATGGSSIPEAGTWNEKLSVQANALDQMQVELDKTFNGLQAERNALAAKMPPAGATAKERDAYRQQVDALNAKIERYEAQYVDFKEKEKAFNARYRK